MISLIAGIVEGLLFRLRRCVRLIPIPQAFLPPYQELLETRIIQPELTFNKKSVTFKSMGTGRFQLIVVSKDIFQNKQH